jgi:tetratricopeptide (TPR) repeat protein
LGDVLRRLKKRKDAEVAIRRALLIRERLYGRSHPYFAGGLRALGKLYLDQSATSEAEELLKAALTVFRASFPSGVVAVALCERDLGRVFQQDEKFAQAEGLFHAAAVKFERELGLGHSNTVSALHLRAAALRELGNSTEADSVEARALEGLSAMDETSAARRPGHSLSDPG